jgi:fatty-acyl-CoA synthase
MLSPTTRTQLRLLRSALPLVRYQPGSRRTVADLIERQARRRAAHTFVRFEGREVSYADYNAAANQVAHWAHGRGLARGDTVALLLENRPEFLSTWAGLAKAGVTAALLNTNLTGRALGHVLEEGGAKLLVVGEELLASLETLAPEARAGVEVFVLRDPGVAAHPALPEGAKELDRELVDAPTRNPDRRIREGVRAGDPLFFIYTSGTTGLPKAARFSHSRFVGGGTQHLAMGFSRDDTCYCALPLYHTVGGILAVDAVLAAGATLALRRRFSARAF